MQEALCKLEDLKKKTSPEGVGKLLSEQAN